MAEINYINGYEIADKKARTDVNTAQTTANEAKTKNNSQDTQISALQTQISGLASGSPLAASSTDDMTDTTKIYVNTTDGYWYYYDGDSWEPGGVYQATEDSDTVTKLQTDIGYISEGTINKWQEDNTKTFTRYIDLTLDHPIAANTLTFSALVTGDLDEVSFIPYHDTTSFGRRYLDANTGNRSSATFTAADTVNRIVLYSGSTNQESTGNDATYTDIQIEVGESATPYVPPLTAHDRVARKEFKDIILDIGKKFNLWTYGNVTEDNKTTILDEESGEYTLSFVCDTPSSFRWYAYHDEVEGSQQIGGGEIVAETDTRQLYTIASAYSINRIYFNCPSDVTVENIQLEKRVYYRDRWSYSEEQVVTDLKPYATPYVNPNDTESVMKALSDKCYWSGKTIYFNGDSITAGTAGETGLDEGVAYVNTINDILRFGKVRNYAIGGTRCALCPDVEQPPLVSRISNMGNDADIIFIMINTNDYASQIPIGTDDSVDTTTFKGALNSIFTYLRNTYPTIPIIISTMPTRKPNYDGSVELPITIEQYQQAVVDMVHKYKFILYDAFYRLGLDWRYEWIHRAEGYHTTRDGLHPNNIGAELMGRKIAEFIKEQ